MSMLSHSQARAWRLRLELPVSFGRLHVLPIVNQFMSKWPELSVNVSFKRSLCRSDRRRHRSGDPARRQRRQPPDDAIAGAPPSRHLCVAGLSEEARSARGISTNSPDHSCLAFRSRRPTGASGVSPSTGTFARGRQRSIQFDQRGGLARRHARGLRHREARDLPDQRPSPRRTPATDSQRVFAPTVPRFARSIRRAATCRQKSAPLSTSS